jgi:hypothetical protein
MATLDGATTLDSAGCSLAVGGAASVSPQGTLNLSQTNENEIVDIRCSTANGTAFQASLIAITVDALSGSLGS